MKKKLVICLTFFSALSSAQPYYLGLQWHQTIPFAPSSFKETSDYGKGGGLLLGYRLDEKWATELGYDQFGFGKVNMTHSNVHLSGVFRPSQGKVNPFVRFGLGAGENKFDSALDKQTGLAAQLGGGIEINFRPVTVFMGLNLNYMGKVDSDRKDTQSLNAQIGLLLPGFETQSSNAQHVSAPAVVAEVKKEIVAPKTNEDFISKCLSSNDPACLAAGKASAKINVEFLPGKANVQAEYENEVKRVAEYLKKFPNSTLEIAGHTDDSGSAKLNTTLSQKRADALKAILIQKYGIESQRISAKGFGPSQPLTSNSSVEGRAKNRRVEANITIK